MFSAVDGFRFNSSSTYVALYTSADDPNTLSFFMNDEGEAYIGTSYGTSAPVVKTSFSGYITKSSELTPTPGEPQQMRFIQPDSTGNIFIGGLFFGTDNDAYVVKLDSNLGVIWQKSLVGPNVSPGNSDIVRSGVVDSSDNVIISGFVDSSSGGVGQPFLSKYYGNGTLSFSKTFSNLSTIVDVAVDSSDNIYTLGVQLPTANIDGIALQKFYPNGAFIWGKDYFGNVDISNDSEMAIDSGGNIYVSVKEVSGTGSHITMFNDSGTQQWGKQFKQSSNSANILTTLGLTCDDGNLYCTTELPSLTTTSFIFLKVDSSGNTTWERTISTSSGNLGWGYSSYANGFVATSGGVSGTPSLCVTKIPDDGSQTGIYGTITYANTSTVNSNSFTSSFTTLTDNTSNITLTETTPTWSSNSYTFTANITIL
jgi:hypothetical protein